MPWRHQLGGGVASQYACRSHQFGRQVGENADERCKPRDIDARTEACTVLDKSFGEGRAWQVLGGRFTYSGFHDVVMGEGTLPLPILEARVADWITREDKR